MIDQISKPQVKYTVAKRKLAKAIGDAEQAFELNSMVRIYDPELEINDIVYITKMVQYLDNEIKDTIEISNDDIALTGQTFDSVLSRITQLAD